ncbi:MAG: hypothetical protein NVSMB47_04200 [Polyangiales bacterium]
MMRAAVRRGLAWGLFASAACSACACGGGTRSDPTQDASASASSASSASPLGASVLLGGDVVARVGGRPIGRTLVLDVARARHLSAREALRALIDEALLAAEARTAGAESARGVGQQLAAALARPLVRKYDAEALASGPITDAELDEALGEDWIELARPETRVAVHALIRGETADGEALATALREALLQTRTPEEFLAAAKAFAAPASALVAEALDVPFTRDGRQASPYGASLEGSFAEATFALPAVGATSGLVRTSFGWHVIRLVAIVPPKQASREERVRKLQGRVLARRVGGRFQSMLDDARKAAHVELLATDGDLMLPKLSGAPSAVGP